MPAPKTHKLNPISIAEQIVSLLAAVPGARACFLEKTRGESVHLHSALINSPEVDRWFSTPDFYWIGTYTLGAFAPQVAEDVRETLARVK